MHRADGLLIQCADIDVQPVTNSCDVGDFLRLIRHDGACTNRQDGIRHIICGHIVGDVMHERCILSYIVQIAFQHDCFLLLRRLPARFARITNNPPYEACLHKKSATQNEMDDARMRLK